MLSPGHPTPGLPNFLRPPIASTIGAGILTRFPSATAFALTLGADSPSADERGGGNLGLSASEPFTRFIATHVSIRTSDTSSMPLDTPSPAYGTLSYHVAADSNSRPLRVVRATLAAQVPLLSSPPFSGRLDPPHLRTANLDLRERFGLGRVLAHA